jgi:hypothetical protein
MRDTRAGRHAGTGDSRPFSAARDALSFALTSDQAPHPGQTPATPSLGPGIRATAARSTRRSRDAASQPCSSSAKEFLAQRLRMIHVDMFWLATDAHDERLEIGILTGCLAVDGLGRNDEKIPCARHDPFCAALAEIERH